MTKFYSIYFFNLLFYNFFLLTSLSITFTKNIIKHCLKNLNDVYILNKIICLLKTEEEKIKLKRKLRKRKTFLSEKIER